MYLDLYKIDGTINYDTEPCFHNPETYPRFQEELQEFKDLITVFVTDNISRTFYKFGDGDYRFLRKEPVGSATPGRRALSKGYDQINHEAFVTGAELCDSVSYTHLTLPTKA